MRTTVLLIFLIAICMVRTSAQVPDYCIANRFAETAYFDSSQIKIDSNVVFAIAKNYFTNVMTVMKMDVYYPDTNADPLAVRPFIMLIHGGSFLGGSRSDMSYQCIEFARRGFVTATIDYRLGWNCSGADVFSVCALCGNLNANLKTATYTAAQDAKASMRYIYANANTYHIDTTHLFIGGESAGSITALHSTFWSQEDANAFNVTAVSEVGLLDTAGNSLPPGYSIKGVVNSCGAVNKDSIILNKGNVPVVCFADEYDCVVPPGYGQVIQCLCTSFYYEAGSSVIYNLLIKNGICSEYHEVPASLNHCSFPKPQLVQDASCFLKRVMCNTCQSSFSTVPSAPASCANLTGVENKKTKENLSFTFSNPLTDELKIVFNGNYKTQVAVSITDLLGRTVIPLQKSTTMDELNISTQGLTAGLYLVTVSDGENSITKKLVVSSRY